LWSSGNYKVLISNNLVRESTRDGIYLENSERVTINDNKIYNSTNYAISFGIKVSNSLIYNNLFCGTGLGGVRIDERCYDNIVFNNSFLKIQDNNEDHGTNSYWYSPTLLIGNLWEDWDGTTNFYSIYGNKIGDIFPRRIVSGEKDSDNDGMEDAWEIVYALDDPKADSDGDGLSNLEEYQWMANPNFNDTDGDGLNDYDEVTFGGCIREEDFDGDGLSDYEEVIKFHSFPYKKDSDSDGLTDYQEVITFLTDPMNSDTDDDGMPDSWEVNYNLNPLTNDTLEDLDNDGLTNIEEYVYNTTPNNPDSDSDGLIDGDEVNTYSTNPLKSDTDGDGLSDGDEVNIYLTNPTDRDTDSDGMPDGWEVDFLLNPLENDSNNDSDNDGLTNIEEFNYLTNPNNNDTDGDGISDYNEIFVYNTDPTDSDTDGDGISDYNEIFVYNTDPTDSDTDGDGLSDYNEIYIFSTNPNSNDTDGDGLSDIYEIYVSTDPNNDDTDGDGISDYDEIFVYNTDPTDSDTDGDGISDYQELVNGYNPLKSNAFFIKLSILKIVFYINIFYSSIIFLFLLFTLIMKKMLIQFYRWQEEQYLELNKILIRYENSTEILFLSDFVKDLTHVINQIKEELQYYSKLSLIKKKINTKWAYKLLKKKIDINKYEKMYNNFYTIINQLNYSEIRIISENNEKDIEDEKLDTFLKKIKNERRMLKQYKILITDIVFIFSFIPCFLDSNKKLVFKQINKEIEEKFENANSLLIETLKLSTIKGKKLLEKEEKLSKQIIESRSKEILRRFNIYENELKEWKKRSENILLELLEEDLKEVEDLFQEEKNMLEEVLVQNEIKYKEIQRIKVLIDVLLIYSEIPLIKLQQKLDFTKLEDLEKWIIELSSFLSIKIEGDKLIISETATKEITQSIDELIKRFSEWEKTGEGKKI